jgi:hypothetical protein
MRHPNYMVYFPGCFFFAAPLTLLCLSYYPAYFLFLNVGEMFHYVLLIAEKRMGFEFGLAVVTFVREIKFRTQIYTCTYKFW